MSFSIGGGSGSSRLASDTDVAFSNPAMNHVVTYDSNTQKWTNKASSGNSLVFNVQDYGAHGDGVTEDTSAIQTAINSCNAAGGGTVFFPEGTYMSAGITAASNTVFAGVNAKASILKVISSSTTGGLLICSGKTNIVVQDLGFDGSSHATTKSGVYASTSGSQKNLTVQRCRFQDFMPGSQTTTYGAIYAWTTDGVHILYNELTGCGRAINLGTADGVANIIGNRITATPGASQGLGTMCTGVRVASSSGSSLSKVLIQGNYISGGTLDTGMNGAEGHGISTYRTQDVQIIGNHCENNGRGIIASYQCFGAIIQGNTTSFNRDAGIRVEPEITSFDNTVGTDTARGVIVSGNICHDNAAIGTPGGGNYGIGLEISYAAGSVAQGNICYNNTHSGIHCDSDRVVIIGNTCFDNGRTNADGNNTSSTYAGIYLNSGTGCTITANQCFDNQTVKTQNYGITLNGSGHIVTHNNVGGNNMGDFNNTANIRQAFFGTSATTRPSAPGTATGTDAAVINSLVTSLRNLGLIA